MLHPWTWEYSWV